MIFNNKQWDRDLTVKDFASKNAVRESKAPMIDLTEGMFGTSRSSYLKLENARMIVRHSAKIDENIAGARSRRIENIFVENAQGERFMFPTRQLAPARAMTQHFNHGGSFADEVGQQITQMAQDYSALSQASSFIGMNQPVMAEGASEVREKCRETRKEMRKCFEHLYRESSYEKAAARLNEQASNPVLAEDAAIERLREVLAVEGKELSEDVINAIARCVEAAQPVLDEAEEEVNVADEPRMDARQAVAQEKGETINVLNKEINLAAWDAFKQGSLPTRASPESIQGGSRGYSSQQEEIAHKLGNVAPLVISDSMSNFLSWAADKLASLADAQITQQSRKEQKQLVTLGLHALKSAKVQVNEGLGFRGSKVIREFEEWFDSMGADTVLNRDAMLDEVDEIGMDDPMGDDMGDPMADPTMDVAPAMDAAPAMPMDAMGDTADIGGDPMGDIGGDISGLGAELGGIDAGVEPMGGEIGAGDDEAVSADIAQGYTEGDNWQLDFAESAEAAAACGGEDAVRREIALAVLGGSRNGSVHSLPEQGARRSFAWSITAPVQDMAPIAPTAPPAATMPPAVTPPAPAPYTAPVVFDPAPEATPPSLVSSPEIDFEPLGAADFDMTESEDELTREDILLPKDQNVDLKQEVGHPTDDEDLEPGRDLTMERLRKLSGINIK
jgi:hypothetical protein